MTKEAARIKSMLVYLRAAEAEAAADGAAAEVSELERQLEQQQQEADAGNSTAALRRGEGVELCRALLQQHQQHAEQLEEEEQQQRRQLDTVSRQLRCRNSDAARLQQDLEASREMLVALNEVIHTMKQVSSAAVTATSVAAVADAAASGLSAHPPELLDGLFMSACLSVCLASAVWLALSVSDGPSLLCRCLCLFRPTASLSPVWLSPAGAHLSVSLFASVHLCGVSPLSASDFAGSVHQSLWLRSC